MIVQAIQVQEKQVFWLILTFSNISPNAFLYIWPDNSITILLTHVEMGQGILTTLPMLMAEEPDATWKDIQVMPGPAGKAYNQTFWGVRIAPRLKPARPKTAGIR